MKTGCGSHSCKTVKPTGQGTNGRCRCDDNNVLVPLLVEENQKLKERIGELEGLVYRHVDPMQCDEDDTIIVDDITIRFGG